MAAMWLFPNPNQPLSLSSSLVSSYTQIPLTFKHVSTLLQNDFEKCLKHLNEKLFKLIKLFKLYKLLKNLNCLNQG